MTRKNPNINLTLCIHYLFLFAALLIFNKEAFSNESPITRLPKTVDCFKLDTDKKLLLQAHHKTEVQNWKRYLSRLRRLKKFHGKKLDQLFCNEHLVPYLKIYRPLEKNENFCERVQVFLAREIYIATIGIDLMPKRAKKAQQKKVQKVRQDEFGLDYLTRMKQGDGYLDLKKFKGAAANFEVAQRLANNKKERQQAREKLLFSRCLLAASLDELTATKIYQDIVSTTKDSYLKCIASLRLFSFYEKKEDSKQLSLYHQQILESFESILTTEASNLTLVVEDLLDLVVILERNSLISEAIHVLEKIDECTKGYDYRRRAAFLKAFAFFIVEQNKKSRETSGAEEFFSKAEEEFTVMLKPSKNKLPRYLYVDFLRYFASFKELKKDFLSAEQAYARAVDLLEQVSAEEQSSLIYQNIEFYQKWASSLPEKQERIAVYDKAICFLQSIKSKDRYCTCPNCENRNSKLAYFCFLKASLHMVEQEVDQAQEVLELGLRLPRLPRVDYANLLITFAEVDMAKGRRSQVEEKIIQAQDLLIEEKAYGYLLLNTSSYCSSLLSLSLASDDVIGVFKKALEYAQRAILAVPPEDLVKKDKLPRIYKGLRDNMINCWINIVQASLNKNNLPEEDLAAAIKLSKEIGAHEHHAKFLKIREILSLQ